MEFFLSNTDIFPLNHLIDYYQETQQSDNSWRSKWINTLQFFISIKFMTLPPKLILREMQKNSWLCNNALNESFDFEIITLGQHCNICMV